MSDQVQVEHHPDTGAASVLIAYDVPVPMRDGVVLKADVYSPVGDGPWPTLVIRTPYSKSSVTENAWNGVSPTEAARRGFMVVIQDVRGRNASDGEWEPLRHEGRDGADTIAWAAELPGSSGRVGMVGGSYCGNTQWQAAIEQPPALQVITPLMTWSEPCDGLVARAGVVELAINSSWSLAQGFDWLSRIGLTDDEVAERAGALISDFDRLAEDGLWGLPVAELPVLRRHATAGVRRAGRGQRRRSDPTHARRRRLRARRGPEPPYRGLVRRTPAGDPRQLHGDARTRPPHAPDRRPLDAHGLHEHGRRADFGIMSHAGSVRLSTRRPGATRCWPSSGAISSTTSQRPTRPPSSYSSWDATSGATRSPGPWSAPAPSSGICMWTAA